jgi:hypothetical protein
LGKTEKLVDAGVFPVLEYRLRIMTVECIADMHYVL